MDFCPVCDQQILPQRSTTISPQGKQRILISQAPTPLYCSPACRDSDSPPCSPTSTTYLSPPITSTSSARRHSSALLAPNTHYSHSQQRRPGVSPGPSVDRLTSTSAPSAAAAPLLTFARSARPQPPAAPKHTSQPILSTAARHRRSSSSSEASSSQRTRSRSSSRTSLSSSPPSSPRHHHDTKPKLSGGDYSCDTCLDDLDLEDSDVPTGLVLPATYRSRHSHSRAQQKKADEKRAKSVRGEWEEGWKAYERRLRGGASPTSPAASKPASPPKARKHLAPTPATTTTTTSTLPAQSQPTSRAWSWENLPPERRTNAPALYPVLTLPPQRVKKLTRVFVPTSSSSSSGGRWEEREVEEEVPVDRKRLFYFNAE